MMTREHSAIIKCIAILFIMWYHLTQVATIGLADGAMPFYETILHATSSLNFFLIVTGYGLYLVYKDNRLTWNYLLKRSLKLYLALWLVLLLFVVVLGSIFYPGRFSYSLIDLLVGFSGWRWDYCQFTWFLLPYVLMTFCTPLMFKVMDKVGNVISLIVGVVIYLVTSWLISRYYDGFLRNNYAVYHIVLMCQTFIGVIIGAVFARWVLSGRSLKAEWLKDKSWLVLLGMVCLFILRGQTGSSILNPFFAAVMALGVINVNWSKPALNVMVPIGNKCMMMWFCQGFLGAFMFNEYIQLLYWPALIWLVWVLVTYVVASLLTPVSDWMAKQLKLSKKKQLA